MSSSLSIHGPGHLFLVSLSMKQLAVSELTHGSITLLLIFTNITFCVAKFTPCSFIGTVFVIVEVMTSFYSIVNGMSFKMLLQSPLCDKCHFTFAAFIFSTLLVASQEVLFKFVV